MFIRLFIIFAILVFIVYLTMWFAKRRLLKWLKELTPNPAEPAKKIEGEKLVSCQQCHTFIPKSQATQVEEVFYCPEHAPRQHD